MKSLITICSMLLALACRGSEPFRVDFTDPDSITITNIEEKEITLSGRFLGKDRAFVPSLYAEKKVNGEWEAYPWDWCGTGRKTYSIKRNESFTFPYQYHRAIGQVKVHLLGKEYEFENTEGHDLPTPNESIRKAQLVAADHKRDLSKILEASDLVKRKKMLTAMEVELKSEGYSDSYSIRKEIRAELSFVENFLANGITKHGTNKSGDDNSE